MTAPNPKAESEAREALKAYDNPPTETRSREWGEYQLGAKYTRATGQPWECDVNDQRVMLCFAESARDLPPVSECDQGGWNERYYAHVGRELLRRFPEMHAECEALRVYRSPRRTPDPAHLRTVLALLDEARKMGETFTRLETWSHGHKARSVSIESPDSYGAGCWMVTLGHEKGATHAAECSFFTFGPEKGGDAEYRRQAEAAGAVFVLGEDDDSGDWPGLERTIRCALDAFDRGVWGKPREVRDNETNASLHTRLAHLTAECEGLREVAKAARVVLPIIDRDTDAVNALRDALAAAANGPASGS